MGMSFFCPRQLLKWPSENSMDRMKQMIINRDNVRLISV